MPVHETHIISLEKPAFVSKFALISSEQLNQRQKSRPLKSPLQPSPWQHSFTDLESHFFLKASETKPCAKSKEQRVLFSAAHPRPVIKGKIKLSQACSITSPTAADAADSAFV